ncbi:hypothetical protein [Nocardioides panaciterrulae]|uniref:Uncharacterized protein n=1 Tax=Nocardioides panaciterrulae TaxID=661492 RepID=A0A7Y9E3R4_9ACTN|nr:hypothetical protein [Nocardioides panaciterrulae]NYD40515.1 hypothetical protein [Nocardioides panaciterrulae]
MSDHKQPTVKPRGVWLGLILALAGAVLIGLGVAFTSWIWAIAGVVVLLVGGTVGVRGGVMYDAHRVAPKDEVKQAVHGEQREGVKPGAMLEDPKVRRKSRELDRVRLLEEYSSRNAPRPPLANAAAMVAALVGLFLLVAQWGLYPIGYVSQTNANWSLGFSILCSAGALRILFGQPGRHLLSTLVILLCGVGLVLRGFLANHEIGGTVGAEVACGVLLLLSGVVALASPGKRLEDLPTQREPDRVDLAAGSHAH